MMQFYMSNGLLLLGITKGNVEKLTEGKPIFFEPKGKEPIKKIAIMYGENKPAILEELQKLKFDVPQWMWDVARNEPS